MENIYSNNNATYIHTLKENDPIIDKKVICKYLSLNAFLDLLKNRRIRLSNIATYDDKYEGIPLYKEIIDGFSLSLINKGEEYNKQRLNNLLIGRNAYYASCWNMRSKESFLMWNTYSNFTNGILIFSTVKKLLNSITINNFENTDGELERYFYGEIDYGYKRPYKTDHIKAFAKPDYYKDEKEFRIVIYEHPLKKLNGKYINISPELLINRIVISPRSTIEYYKLIKEQCSISGIKDIKVHKSRIFDDSKIVLERFLKDIGKTKDEKK